MVLQRLPVPDEAPPPRPAHFDDARYELPAHRDYPLAAQNAHPNDGLLEFFEAPHVYIKKSNGRATSASMTDLAHARQEHFNPDGAIAGMKGSRKGWPRVKYVHDPRRVEDCADEAALATQLVPGRGLMLVSHDGETTYAACKAHDFADDVRGVDLLRALVLTAGPRLMMDADQLEAVGAKRARPWESTDDGEPPSFVVHTFEREMTPVEIKQAWSDNGMLARNMGTEAHLQMQWAVEATPFRTDDAEVKAGLAFFELIGSEWRAYRSEWEIFYEEADLAGSVDLVIARGGPGHPWPDGSERPLELAVVDYKRSVALPDRMFAPRRMRDEFKHLDDCDGASYALQLAGYQYVLERMGFTVVDRVLMSIHPDRPYCTSVPYLAEEIEFLMARCRALHAARQTVPARCPTTDVPLRCSLCGEPLHNAVRSVAHPDAGPVDRKKALTLGWEGLERDHATIARVDAHVQAALEPVELPKGLATWKARMPRSGYLRPSIYAPDAVDPCAL